MSVRHFTGGRGVDHVIDVGGPSTLHQSMLASRVGGHMAMIGLERRREPAPARAGPCPAIAPAGFTGG
jgi:NADPH:quinone reductase-like Zn-dependent oxidoreductase